MFKNSCFSITMRERVDNNILFLAHSFPVGPYTIPTSHEIQFKYKYIYAQYKVISQAMSEIMVTIILPITTIIILTTYTDTHTQLYLLTVRIMQLRY